jgi:hypothetical protein
MPSSAANDLAVSVDFNSHTKPSDRQDIINKLFSGVQHGIGGTVEWQGTTFSVHPSDRLRQTLLKQFGCQVDLGTIDQRIRVLVDNDNGWLESSETNEVILTSGVISADLTSLCDLACATLSPDIEKIMKALLSNLGEILTTDKWMSSCHRVDVNVFESSAKTVLVVHAHFDQEVRSEKVKFWVFSNKKRSVLIRLALRRIGITQQYVAALLGQAVSPALSTPQTVWSMSEPGQAASSTGSVKQTPDAAHSPH